jgi:hypothetical protein
MARVCRMGSPSGHSTINRSAVTCTCWWLGHFRESGDTAQSSLVQALPPVQSLGFREEQMKVSNRPPVRCSGCTLRFLALILVLLSQQLALQAQSVHDQSTSQASSTAAKGAKPAQPNCTNSGTYVNSKGQTVPRPENCSGPPKGATAQCRDGSYSFSQSRRGTCSHHGGVAKSL